MKLLLYILTALTLSSCALTSPEGTLELMADIDQDRNERQDSSRRALVGKPVFLKVRAYPKVVSGNIYGGYWIWLQVKREALDIGQLMQELEN